MIGFDHLCRSIRSQPRKSTWPMTALQGAGWSSAVRIATTRDVPRTIVKVPFKSRLSLADSSTGSYRLESQAQDEQLQFPPPQRDAASEASASAGVAYLKNIWARCCQGHATGALLFIAKSEPLTSEPLGLLERRCRAQYLKLITKSASDMLFAAEVR